MEVSIMSHSTKNIIHITLLLVFIIGSGVITAGYLNKSSRELSQCLEKIEQYTNNDDWDLALKEISIMEDKWSRIKKVWATLTDHAEIDNITSSISRASKYIEIRDQSPALAEISVLSSLISHIPKKELPTIDNIF
jgi:hypothetical protein